jgi:hypothetical protein
LQGLIGGSKTSEEAAKEAREETTAYTTAYTTARAATAPETAATATTATTAAAAASSANHHRFILVGIVPRLYLATLEFIHLQLFQLVFEIIHRYHLPHERTGATATYTLTHRRIYHRFMKHTSSVVTSPNAYFPFS